jgi:hypothetical protein
MLDKRHSSREELKDSGRLLAKVVIGIFALLGISTTFTYGLTNLFGFGTRTLVDVRFIFSSLSTAVLFIVGTFAMIRFSFFISVPFVLDRQRLRKIKDRSQKRPLVFLAIGGAMTLLLNILFLVYVLSSFLDYEAAVFFVALFLFLSFLCLGALWKFNAENIELSDARLFGFTIKLIAHIRAGRRLHRVRMLFPAVVAVVLTASVLLGAARFHSLSSAKPMCFSTSDGAFMAALIGESDHGYFYVVEPVPIFSMGLIGPDAATESFINRSGVISISTECNRQS